MNETVTSIVGMDGFLFGTLVPFLFGPRGENLYDSSAIGAWFDAQGLNGAAPLLPAVARRWLLLIVRES